MIKIFPYELKKYLKKNFYYYFLIGDDVFFLQESQKYILKKSKKNFYEKILIDLNIKNDWNEIFSLLKVNSLFFNKKILLLIFPKYGTNNLIDKNLNILYSVINKNIKIIFKFEQKYFKKIKEKKWFKKFINLSILVDCSTILFEKLPKWIYFKAKNLKINLDNKSCIFLSCYYYGNLFALNQIFKQIIKIYPKKIININLLKKFISNVSQFKPIDLVNTIFTKRINYSYYILNKLRFLSIEPIFILREIQKEIYTLLILKKELQKFNSINFLFNKYKICKKRYKIQKYALKNFNFNKIKNSLKLMIKIEIIIKENTNDLIWEELNMLIYILCK